jgi:methionyl-tRNA formyltransferase
LLQPTNLKDETFQAELKALGAQLFVVVAFRMLPQSVWDMPPLGSINLHASLLPQYRGAAPINWAIINGEKETGITTFFIEQEIDTGKVIERESVPIFENETAGELHDRLLELGRKLVYRSVLQIIDGSVQRVAQEQLVDESTLKPAPKIFKPMCEIKWDNSIEEIHNHCRGLSPYPTAWTSIFNAEKNEKRNLKIFKTEKTNQVSNGKTELIFEKTGILFPTKDYYLRVLELQPEGKRRMTYTEFSAGYGRDNWAIISSN